LRTEQDISEEEINRQKEFLDRVDQSTLANYEDLEKRKLEDLRLEKKEGDPQEQVAQELTGLLQGKEQAERIQKASEQLLVEGATAEEVAAEQKAAQEAERAQREQEERAQFDKEYVALVMKVRDFLGPVPVISYMAKLLTKQKGRGNKLDQNAISFISESIKRIKDFTVPYLQQYGKYSFKEEDIASLKEVKKLYILSLLLKNVSKIKQLSSEMKQEIRENTSAFDKIFSVGLSSLLRAVEDQFKLNPKYAAFKQRIIDLNK
jgi:hypothetical protein